MHHLQGRTLLDGIVLLEVFGREDATTPLSSTDLDPPSRSVLQWFYSLREHAPVRHASVPNLLCPVTAFLLTRSQYLDDLRSDSVLSSTGRSAGRGRVIR